MKPQNPASQVRDGDADLRRRTPAIVEAEQSLKGHEVTMKTREMEFAREERRVNAKAAEAEVRDRLEGEGS